MPHLEDSVTRQPLSSYYSTCLFLQYIIFAYCTLATGCTLSIFNKINKHKIYIINFVLK